MEERKFDDNPANADLFREAPSSQKRRSDGDQSSASSSSKRARTSGNEVGVNVLEIMAGREQPVFGTCRVRDFEFATSSLHITSSSLHQLIVNFRNPMSNYRSEHYKSVLELKKPLKSRRNYSTTIHTWRLLNHSFQSGMKTENKNSKNCFMAGTLNSVV